MKYECKLPPGLILIMFDKFNAVVSRLQCCCQSTDNVLNSSASAGRLKFVQQASIGSCQEVFVVEQLLGGAGRHLHACCVDGSDHVATSIVILALAHLPVVDLGCLPLAASCCGNAHESPASKQMAVHSAICKVCRYACARCSNARATPLGKAPK